MRVNPWEHPIGKNIWKTQASFMSFIRGGIRKGLWMRHPLKLEFIKRKRKRLPLGRKTKKNPEGLVWGAECECCGKDFRPTEIQVDHIQGNHSLKTEDDIQEFVMNMIYIDPDKDLQLVCKPCHKTKSYAEKQGISFEDAHAEKQGIEIIKNKKDIQFLKDNGIIPASNQKLRRNQIVEYLKENPDASISSSSEE